MSKRQLEAVLFWAGRERFTIGECEMLARDLDAHDTMTFELVGPTGRLKARWLDAYFGLFQIEGQDGMLSASQFQYAADIHCEALDWPHAAQGTEAGTAETEGLGPKDDGPVDVVDAPTPSTPPHIAIGEQG